MGIEPCVTGPVERYEAENKKFLKKSTLLSIYTWLAVSPEDSRAENPVTTVTAVFSHFTFVSCRKHLGRPGDGGLKNYTGYFFGLAGALGSEALD